MNAPGGLSAPPAVSVLMSVANGAFLDPAIASLLAQRFDDFELVIVADATDGQTTAALRAWAARDARIVLLENPRRLGLPASLNRGLARVRAPLVARADADDIYHPERLIRQVPVFARRPGLGALSCGHHRIDAEGRHLETHTPVTGHDRLRLQLMFLNPMLHPGVMFRTDLVRSLGGYDERYWTAQDTDLWARLAERAEIDALPEPLVDWRKHGSSQLATRGTAGQALSLEISARLQSSYLGRPIAPEAAAAARETWRAFVPLAPGTARMGAEVLALILARAATRERAPALRHLRLTIAAALARQARWLLRRDPRTAAFLTAEALRASLGVRPQGASPADRHSAEGASPP